MLSVLQIADSINAPMWASMRVIGLVLIAPVLGAVFAPARVRVVIAVVLSVAMLPAVQSIPEYSPLSALGILTVLQEIVLGLAIGFAMMLAVEAAVFAGQVISTGMGLSFATVVDPQMGNIPLLGRLYVIVATLLLLAMDAHLALIDIVAQSYALIPIGSGGIDAGAARYLVEFAQVLFTGAMQLALPSVVAILMVNIAFGVISRAAPTLNLFAVGFPISMTMGFVVLIFAVRGNAPIWTAQFERALTAIGQLLGGG
ncbi:MAG: flagellar biosynthetic protein FliR [Gammaproteobacteria bacterium]|nr:flagellar biosynthetic protein FliR [Gammaproteobacteria bacterium]